MVDVVGGALKLAALGSGIDLGPLRKPFAGQLERQPHVGYVTVRKALNGPNLLLVTYTCDGVVAVSDFSNFSGW